jgi:hypothetical protein
MARISRATNQKISDERWAGIRPSTIGAGLGAIATLGGLGVLAQNYPKQATRLGQRFLHGVIGNVPRLMTEQPMGTDLLKFGANRIIGGITGFQ